MGNLSATTPQNDLEKLINKWFYGTDVPIASYSYAPISGELFKDGVSASDVNQGSAGTCYFLAALGAVANANPSLITNDFIHDNKDGTYGVRFFAPNGDKYYVTVDSNLPMSNKGTPDEGTTAFAKTLNDELWVGLAEKAYTQINAQKILFRDDPSNSYQAIGGGSADPLQQITGVNYRWYSQSKRDENTHTSDDPNTYKAEIISLLKNGSAGWLHISNTLYDKDGHYELFPGHAFMLLGYDDKTDTFKIRNPWGDRGDLSKTISEENYLPEFNLPIEKFWGNNCQIVLTDPLLKNPNYSYTVNSNTGTTKENAIMEGNAAHLSVERDSPLNMNSMIYYCVQPNSTKGTLDQSIVSKVAIDFMWGVSTQHLNVPIYKDSLKEGIESFNVDFYKSFYDTTPFNEIKLFVKDAIVDNSIYIMTNVDSDVAKEGWWFTLNIERSDTSTASTVLY